MRYLQKILFALVLTLALVLYLEWGRLASVVTRVILEDLLKQPVAIHDVQVGTTTITASNLVVGRPSQDYALAASVLIAFDIKRLLSRNFAISSLEFRGLQIRSPEGALTLAIESAIAPSSAPPLISADVEQVKILGPVRVSSGTIEAVFDSEEIALRIPSLELTGAGDLHLHLMLPRFMAPLRSFEGPFSIGGNIDSPKVQIALKQSYGDLLSLFGTMEHGRLFLRPSIERINSRVAGEVEFNPLDASIRIENLRGENLDTELFVEGLAGGKLNFEADGKYSLHRLKGEIRGKLAAEKKDLPLFQSLTGDFTLSEPDLLLLHASVQGDAGEVQFRADSNFALTSINARLASPHGVLLTRGDKLVRNDPKSFVVSGELLGAGSLASFDVSGVLKAENGAGTRAEVQLQLQSGLRDLLAAHGSLVLQSLTIGDFVLERPLSLQVRERKIVLPETEVTLGSEKVRLLGALDQESIALTVEGDVPLAAVLLENTLLDDVQGVLSSQVKISGSPRSPILTGTMTLENGGLTLDLGEESIVISGAVGEVVFDDRTAELRKLSGHLGAGEFSVTGELSEFLSRESRKTALEWSFSRLMLEPMEGLATTFSGNGDLTIEGVGRPMVTGTITLDQALYEQRLELRKQISDFVAFLSGSRAQSKVRGEKVFPLDLELSLKGDRTILFDTDVVQAELSTDLVLKSEDKRIYIDGQIESSSADLYLGRSELDVSRAVVSFNHLPLGDLPSIELLAEGFVGIREQYVFLSIKGELPNPTVAVRSETGSDDREVLAMLAGGLDAVPLSRSNRSLSLVEAVDPYSDLALLDRVTGLTGVTEVEIESGFSADTGEFAPKIRLNRPLPFDLLAVAEAELTQFSRTQLNIEYSLTEQTNAFVGWRNAPTTKNPESLSGSFGLGVHYRERFSGAHLFPLELILENFRELGE